MRGLAKWAGPAWVKRARTPLALSPIKAVLLPPHSIASPPFPATPCRPNLTSSSRPPEVSTCSSSGLVGRRWFVGLGSSQRGLPPRASGVPRELMSRLIS